MCSCRTVWHLENVPGHSHRQHQQERYDNRKAKNNVASGGEDQAQILSNRAPRRPCPKHRCANEKKAGQTEYGELPPRTSMPGERLAWLDPVPKADAIFNAVGQRIRTFSCQCDADHAPGERGPKRPRSWRRQTKAGCWFAGLCPIPEFTATFDMSAPLTAFEFNLPSTQVGAPTSSGWETVAECPAAGSELAGQ